MVPVLFAFIEVSTHVKITQRMFSMLLIVALDHQRQRCVAKASKTFRDCANFADSYIQPDHVLHTAGGGGAAAA